jgi:hypothetical protein
VHPPVARVGGVEDVFGDYGQVDLLLDGGPALVARDDKQRADEDIPAIVAICLLGAWLVTRIPGPAWRAGLTSAAVVTAMFGLGVWSFYAMYAAFDVPLSG